MMTNDSQLQMMFVRATDEVIPPAPWLESQVVDALHRSGRTRPGARGFGRFRGFGSGLRLVAGVVAVLVALVAVAALLMNTRLHSSVAPGVKSTPVQTQSPTPTGPTRDAAVVQLRVAVDGDLRRVEFAFNKACGSQQACATQLVQVRTATETLLQNASAAQPPSQVLPAVARVMSAAQQFINQLDVALILVGEPNSDYRAAAAAPSMSELYLAVAELDCWPNAPVEGEHSGMSSS